MKIKNGIGESKPKQSRRQGESVPELPVGRAYAVEPLAVGKALSGRSCIALYNTRMWSYTCMKIWLRICIFLSVAESHSRVSRVDETSITFIQTPGQKQTYPRTILPLWVRRVRKRPRANGQAWIQRIPKIRTISVVASWYRTARENPLCHFLGKAKRRIPTLVVWKAAISRPRRDHYARRNEIESAVSADPKANPNPKRVSTTDIKLGRVYSCQRGDNTFLGFPGCYSFFPLLNDSGTWCLKSFESCRDSANRQPTNIYGACVR